MKNLIVAYTLASRCGGALNSKEGINIHNLHAQANEGKVLFTTNTVPKPEYQDCIKEIILMTKDGSFAIHADVDSLGRYSLIEPPNDYTKPSIWNNEPKEGYGWFALNNLKQIKINKGEYKATSGKDLIQSMSGAGYMVYIEI